MICLKRRSAVYGVGINDANYAANTKNNGEVSVCPFYERWRAMLKRCYCTKYQDRQPTYIGCTVSADWHSFMAFRLWMHNQEWQGNELDKDIVGSGKVYSAADCVFIPPSLNRFMTDNSARRGDFPVGVFYNATSKRFRASIRILNKSKFLGYFDTPEKAHAAWADAKSLQACRLASEQADARIASGLRRYASVIQAKALAAVGNASFTN